jgi:hypothetical protein
MKDQSEKKASRQILELVSSRPEMHWGDWLKDRARRLGIARLRDLAPVVGCAKSQLFRWLEMEKPPERISKGFDRKLAAALKTDPETLFYRWRYTSPVDAPIIQGAVAEIKDTDWLGLRRERLSRLERGLLILPEEDFKAVEEFVRSKVDSLADRVMEYISKGPKKKPAAHRAD